jgi:class 3 adenylate cyclase
MDLTKVDAPQKGNFLIAFADIQNFTGISLSIADSISLFDLLNGAALIAAGCVAATSGKIIKFIGDECLLIFPEDAADAGTKCMLSMKKRIEAYLSGKGFSNKLKITVHFGEAAVGLFGQAPDRRLDIIGDSVNIASTLGRGEHRGRLVISPQAFRRLSPETRKAFHKYTPPIVYVAEE